MVALSGLFRVGLDVEDSKDQSLRLSVGEGMPRICGWGCGGVWRGGGDDFVQLVIMRYWPW